MTDFPLRAVDVAVFTAQDRFLFTARDAQGAAALVQAINASELTAILCDLIAEDCAQVPDAKGAAEQCARVIRGQAEPWEADLMARAAARLGLTEAGSGAPMPPGPQEPGESEAWTIGGASGAEAGR